MCHCLEKHLCAKELAADTFSSFLRWNSTLILYIQEQGFPRTVKNYNPQCSPIKDV